jgi:CDP-glycerol glycerophosphotransferase (TagB/SpsB family)
MVNGDHGVPHAVTVQKEHVPSQPIKTGESAVNLDISAEELQKIIYSGNIQIVVKPNTTNY